MKHLVTGGAGFIGSTLVKKLAEQGHEVVVVDDHSSSGGELLNENSLKLSVKTVSGNISYIKTQTGLHEKLQDAFEGVDTVFHLAAKARVQPSIKEPVYFNATNVEGTLNMLEYARKAEVRRFVFTSSSSIYGNTDVLPTPETLEPSPLSPYGLQKLIGEQYCQLYSRIHDMDTVCLRYFNVYGPGAPTQGAYCLVIGKFIQQALEGKNLTIFGNGQQRRDFTHVDDVVQANILSSLSKEKFTGDVFNIGNGDNKSVQDIADVFKLPCDYLPERLEPKATLAENSKARQILGWKPSGHVTSWLEGYLQEVLKK
jgi:UDP-glucose 4-epimerase